LHCTHAHIYRRMPAHAQTHRGPHSPLAYSIADLHLSRPRCRPTLLRAPTRGCHGYIPEDDIRALYPYPLRIRAVDAYPKCFVRKGGEDVSILSDRNCKNISDPYPRYESQDTGIYTVIRLPAPGEFWLNTVDLSFRVPTIEELTSEHLGAKAAIQPDPGETVQSRDSTRLRCWQSVTRDSKRSI